MLANGVWGFFSDNKDQLALAVSLMALAASLLTTWWSTRVSERAARAATFQRMHEMLVEPAAARGRRLLFQAHAAQRFPALGDAAWDDINYSLALYDTLGGYLHRGEVDREAVLGAWHHPLLNIAEPVRAFMTHRETSLTARQPWTWLMELLAAAEGYTCTCQ